MNLRASGSAAYCFRRRGHDSLAAAYAPIILNAAGLTIWLSWLALLIGAVGGLLLALMRISGFLPLRLIALLYTEFFRSIPILIVLFLCFYGVPLLTGVDLSAFAAATVALGLHATSMMSEVDSRRHRPALARASGRRHSPLA